MNLTLILNFYLNISMKFLMISPNEIMITDGYSAFPTIIQDLGMLQQRCVFHMIYNTVMMIYPVIRRFLKNNRGKYTKLKNTNQKLQNALTEYDPKVGRITKADKKHRLLHDLITNLEKEIQNINQNIKNTDDKVKELLEYLDKFSEIFKSKNKKRSTKTIKHIKKQDKISTTNSSYNGQKNR